MILQLLHPVLRDTAHKQHRKAMVMLFSMVTLFVFYLFYSAYFLFNYPLSHHQNINNNLGYLLFVVYFLLIRFTKDIKWPLVLINFGCLPLMYHSIYQTGGLYSSDIVWMLLSIISCILFIDIYFGVLAAIISAGYLIYLYSSVQGVSVEANPFLQYIIADNTFHYLFTWIFVMMLIVVILISFTLNLEKANKKIDDISQNKIKDLEEQLLKMTNNISLLRSEISKDFHDEMGNKLASISIMAETLGHKIEQKEPTEALTSIIEDINTKSREVYSGTKDFIWTIDWKNDYIQELFNYIRNFAEDFLNIRNININVHTNVDQVSTIRINPNLSRQILFICKEIFTNAIKHAQCDEIDFSFMVEGKELHIQIKDNGIGFNTKQNFTRGIQNIFMRSERIGASCQLHAEINAGSAYFIQLPLPEMGKLVS